MGAGNRSRGRYSTQVGPAPCHVNFKLMLNRLTAARLLALFDTVFVVVKIPLGVGGVTLSREAIR